MNPSVLSILSVSRRPEGMNYCVKVPDDKNPRGYDLVNVLRHDNGAMSLSSASRSTRTPFIASKYVKKYLAADMIEREAMRTCDGELLRAERMKGYP